MRHEKSLSNFAYKIQFGSTKWEPFVEMQSKYLFFQFNFGAGGDNVVYEIAYIKGKLLTF